MRTPIWIAVAAILTTAQVTGAFSVFTTAASILTGIDGTVNAVLDVKKWAPQVKDYFHERPPVGRVLLAPKRGHSQVVRVGKDKQRIAHPDRRGAHSDTVSKKKLPAVQRERITGRSREYIEGDLGAAAGPAR